MTLNAWIPLLLCSLAACAAAFGDPEVIEDEQGAPNLATDLMAVPTPTPEPIPFPNIADVNWQRTCELPTGPLSVTECTSGGCLEKIELDTSLYPDAVCNDGSPGVMYVRSAPVGSLDADKWVFHLEGGRGCAGPGECVERYCGDGFYDASKMSSAWTPDAIEDNGIFKDRADNNFADWNHVFLYYCSSDQWLGSTSKVMLGFLDGTTTVNYSLEFRGYEIVVAALRTLKAATETTSAGAVADLDDATNFLLTSSSAGSAGARQLADQLRIQLTQSNEELDFRAVFDSADAPTEALINGDVFPGGVAPAGAEFATMDELITASAERLDTWDAVRDTSCLSMHVADPEQCSNGAHVLFNHVVTPFFVRQALLEKVAAGADEQLWSNEAHAHLSELADLQTSAEEAASISIAPGVFGPRVDTHTSLTAGRFHTEEIDGFSAHDVLWNWFEGSPDDFVLEAP